MIYSIYFSDKNTWPSIRNYAVRLRGLIGQHSKDELLIDALANLLGYGTTDIQI